MTIKITKAVAAKVLATVDAGLVKGIGEPKPGAMCVEAAVCYAMGLPHSDEPDCVSRAIRDLNILLNDAGWSSNAARAKGMRRLVLAQLGSAGAVDDVEFAKRVAELSIHMNVPAALRAAASIHPYAHHKGALVDAAIICERDGTEASARSARSAAWSAWSAAEAEAARSARDGHLSTFAEGVVQILIAMKSPGCKWLSLTE